MKPIKDIEHELGQFRERLTYAAGFVLFCFFLLALRLVWLQVVRYGDLSAQAERNRVAVVPIVPNRGLILDRNGVVLASNYSAYTLEIIPSKVKNIEAMIDALSKVVDIQPRDRKRFKRMQEESKNFESLPIRTRLTDEEVARFAAQRFRFPGVEIKARLFRNYPLVQVGSHVIGYIGRVNKSEKDVIDDGDDADNYQGTEYIGKLGIEQSYEKDLHGTTGFEELENTAGGKAVRRLDTKPSPPGNTIVLSLDIKLQYLVEELFGDRRGALVAIEPKTGQILAFVSKPTFDPNMFVDGIDPINWKSLNESEDKPLLNRPLRGLYPPGSTFKPFMALAGLQTGKRTPTQTISDPGYFWFGNHKFRDDKEGGHGSVDMVKSIVESCDTYYYMLANDLGVDVIHATLSPFGFGQITGVDIMGESKGVLPSTEWKRTFYKKAEQQKWYAGETISVGIGQGYNSYTMLQLAHATATLVNNGIRMKPHLVKEVVDVNTRQRRLVASEPLGQIPIKPEHVEVIRQAMVNVNLEGTSASSFRGATYTSGGKTGTAQVVQIKQNEKYDAAKVDERHRDHALFIAFAPAEDPQIALSLIVENSGFGAMNAAPIARRVFDYYLQGLYPGVEDLDAVKKAQATTPIGKPRKASEVSLPSFNSPANNPAGAP
jgi:penicillin-binding protein 2